MAFALVADDIDSVYEKFEGTWRSIASYFKNYDEHLIFESINELTCMEGDMKNSSQAKAYDIPIIVNLNQIFVNVVRSTDRTILSLFVGCIPLCKWGN